MRQVLAGPGPARGVGGQEEGDPGALEIAGARLDLPEREQDLRARSLIGLAGQIHPGERHAVETVGLFVGERAGRLIAGAPRIVDCPRSDGLAGIGGGTATFDRLDVMERQLGQVRVDGCRVERFDDLGDALMETCPALG